MSSVGTTERPSRVGLAAHAVLSAVVVGALLAALVVAGYAAAPGVVVAVVAVVAVLVVLVVLALLARHYAAAGRRRVPAPGSGARGAGTAGISLGAGAVCWLVWLALPGALGRPWPEGDPLGVALPGPVAALVGAAVSAVVIALVLAALTRSILAPLGAGAGLWMAHGVWLFGLDDALWAFAAVLALPVAVAVAAVAMAVAAVAGLLGGALDEGATPGRYGYPLTSTLRPTPRPGRGGSG